MQMLTEQTTPGTELILCTLIEQGIPNHSAVADWSMCPHPVLTMSYSIFHVYCTCHPIARCTNVYWRCVCPEFTRFEGSCSNMQQCSCACLNMTSLIETEKHVNTYVTHQTSREGGEHSLCRFGVDDVTYFGFLATRTGRQDRKQLSVIACVAQVRQQHLLNLEALLQEELRSGADSALRQGADSAATGATLPMLAATLLSTVDDPSVVESGISGQPDRPARAALALEAAIAACSNDQDQVRLI